MIRRMRIRLQRSARRMYKLNECLAFVFLVTVAGHSEGVRGQRDNGHAE
jgi:hypothetical protein